MRADYILILIACPFIFTESENFALINVKLSYQLIECVCVTGNEIINHIKVCLYY